jgi:hypothetical protein
LHVCDLLQSFLHLQWLSLPPSWEYISPASVLSDDFIVVQFAKDYSHTIWGYMGFIDPSKSPFDDFILYA